MDKQTLRKRKRGFLALITALMVAVSCFVVPAGASSMTPPTSVKLTSARTFTYFYNTSVPDWVWDDSAPTVCFAGDTIQINNTDAPEALALSVNGEECEGASYVFPDSSHMYTVSSITAGDEVLNVTVSSVVTTLVNFHWCDDNNTVEKWLISQNNDINNFDLTQPTYDSYTFTGKWYYNPDYTGDEVQVITVTTADNTTDVYAKWNENNHATVSFWSNVDNNYSGTKTSEGSKKVYNSGGVQTPQNFSDATTNALYRIVNWHESTSLNDEYPTVAGGYYSVSETDVGGNESLNLYAEVEEKNIAIFHTNGGALTGATAITANQKYYTAYDNSADFSLDGFVPTLNGQIFKGWHAVAALTDSFVTSIAAASTGHKDLYAEWETPEPDAPPSTVKIVWNDSDDKDQLRPSSLTASFEGKNYALNSTNSWTYTVESPASEESEWALDAPEGYTVKKSKSDNTTTFTLTHTPAPEVTYTVTYDKNGATSGDVPTDANAYAANSSVTVLGKNTLAKDGYTFKEWNTKADGTGTSYAEGAKFAITANTSLYAQWTKDAAPETTEPEPEKPHFVKPTYVPPTTKEPETTKAPEETNVPVEPSIPDTTKVPDTTPEPEKQPDVPKPGDVITLTDPVIPAKLLEQIKGQDIEVIIELDNGMKWTINGLSITDNISDINLNISSGTNIPVDVINRVTGERFSIMIHLDYDGPFPFDAVLTVNLQAKNAGYYANLFYYNPETNELEFVSASIIDENGDANLNFYHASDYTIIIDKLPMNGEENPHTGAVLGGLTLLTLAGAAMIVSKKRK